MWKGGPEAAQFLFWEYINRFFRCSAAKANQLFTSASVVVNSVEGGGIESTSHKVGLFHHVCTQYEVVTADGEVVIADLETNADMFHSLPFSYGTLGFLTSVTIRIETFKPFVKLTYRPTYSLEDTRQLLDKETYR
jgi:FAD/FMN-containing dehydrogenase